MPCVPKLYNIFNLKKDLSKLASTRRPSASVRVPWTGLQRRRREEEEESWMIEWENGRKVNGERKKENRPLL